MVWENTTACDKAVATARSISGHLEEAGMSRETQRSIVDRCGEGVRDITFQLFRVELEFQYREHPNLFGYNMPQKQEAQIDDQERDLDNAPVEDNSRDDSLPERAPLQRAEPLNDRFKEALEEHHKDQKEEEERKDKIIKEVNLLLDEMIPRTK